MIEGLDLVFEIISKRQLTKLRRVPYDACGGFRDRWMVMQIFNAE